MTLNDGGTATYSGGSGSTSLTFTYTVSASNSAVSALVITQGNEPNGATITDVNGNAASLAGAVTTFPNLEIDPASDPMLASVVDLPSSGAFNVGRVITLTLNMSEAVTVAGGIPTLTLNDGGIATDSGGSGTSSLSFTYTVGSGQNTASLAATAVNLNSAAITDGAGRAAILSLIGLTQSGPRLKPRRRR